tara:strand:- start:17116 stop:17307 length:192 start_codon:yes stop_codon:yes gene_type:complete
MAAARPFVSGIISSTIGYNILTGKTVPIEYNIMPIFNNKGIITFKLVRIAITIRLKTIKPKPI